MKECWDAVQLSAPPCCVSCCWLCWPCCVFSVSVSGQRAAMAQQELRISCLHAQLSDQILFRRRVYSDGALPGILDSGLVFFLLLLLGAADAGSCKDRAPLEHRRPLTAVTLSWTLCRRLALPQLPQASQCPTLQPLDCASPNCDVLRRDAGGTLRRSSVRGGPALPWAPKHKGCLQQAHELQAEWAATHTRWQSPWAGCTQQPPHRARGAAASAAAAGAAPLR